MMGPCSPSTATAAPCAPPCRPTLLVAMTEKLWSLLCEQVGVAALGVPEEYDGAGVRLPRAAVVLEQLGHGRWRRPAAGQVVATEALLAVRRHRGLCPSAARHGGGLGRHPGLVGRRRHGGRARTASEAGRAGSPARCRVVLDGDTADVLLVAASTGDGAGLFEVPVDAPR